VLATQIHNKDSLLHRSLNTHALSNSAENNLKSSVNNISIVDSLPKILLRYRGGWINEDILYRTNIDTPFMDKRLIQNNFVGGIGLDIVDRIPFNISFFTQISNSCFLRNIYNVRVDFDPGLYSQRIMEDYKKRLMQLADNSLDSALKTSYNQIKERLEACLTRYNSPLLKQKYLESKEVLNVPEMLYDKQLPDSIAKLHADSMSLIAKRFIQYYERQRDTLAHLQRTYDSLNLLYHESLSKINKAKEILKNPGSITDWNSLKQTERMLQESGISIDSTAQKKYNWVLGLRKMSLGKSQLSYSELTGKNVPLNGINLEYNTWFYAALSAGVVDMRFREFAYQRQKGSPQYYYIGRLGVGNLSRNYLIVSVFGGRKQLYTYNTVSGQNPVSMPISGISIESKLQITKTTYVKAEVAQSVANDPKQTSSQKTGFWSLNNSSNKAFAISFRSTIPKINLTAEGNYKYTGANYQYFGNYQTSANMNVWYIKAEKYLFKKILKISGALRSNDYSNPYVIQQYSSNNIFKSVQVTFRKRKWPVISAAYMPSSQYSVIDKNVYENKIYSFNASINHSYKIGSQRLSSAFIFNKFQNNPNDSGFKYFNALNFYFTQNIFISSLTETLSVSLSENSAYKMSTLDEQVCLPVSAKGNLNIGVRIINLNRLETRIGGYGNFHFRINNKSAIHIGYDQMYYPGQSNILVKSDYANVGYSQSF